MFDLCVDSTHSHCTGAWRISLHNIIDRAKIFDFGISLSKSSNVGLLTFDVLQWNFELSSLLHSFKIFMGKDIRFLPFALQGRCHWISELLRNSTGYLAGHQWRNFNISDVITPAIYVTYLQTSDWLMISLAAKLLRPLQNDQKTRFCSNHGPNVFLGS